DRPRLQDNELSVPDRPAAASHYTNSGAASARSLSARIASSVGTSSNRDAASSTFGSTSTSPALITCTPSRPSDHHSDRSSASWSWYGSYQVEAVWSRPCQGRRAADLIVCTATPRSAQVACRALKFSA